MIEQPSASQPQDSQNSQDGDELRDAPEVIGAVLRDYIDAVAESSMDDSEAAARERIRRLIEQAQRRNDPVAEPVLLDADTACGCCGAGRFAAASSGPDAVDRQVVGDALRKADDILATSRREAARRLSAAERQALAIISQAHDSAARITATIGTTVPLPQRSRTPDGSEGRHIVPANPPQPEQRLAAEQSGAERLAAEHAAANRLDAAVAEWWAQELRRIGGQLAPPDVTLLPLLEGWVARLRSAAAAAPVRAEVGDAIGKDMIAAGLTAPNMLSCTIELLVEQLPCVILHADTGTGPRSQRIGPAQVLPLVAAVAAGYVHGTRTLVQTQQEAMLHAVESAHRQLALTWRVSSRTSGRAARYDALTGLPNRAAFDERVAAAVARKATGRHLGLCLVDLDGFKAVNDKFGTAVGDWALTTIARRLGPFASDDDYLLARLGSDEFALLIEDCAGALHLREVAGRVLKAITRPIKVGDTLVSLQARVGLVDVPARQTTAQQLLRTGYAALRNARNDHTQWHILQPRHGVMVDYIPGGASTAVLDRRNFHLRYAPTVSLRDGSVQGLEALVRYDHPNLGRLTLSQVVDLTGDDAIADCYAELLTTACNDAASWPTRHGTAPYVSVNLPTAIADYHWFADQIDTALSASRLSPHRLRLEVPEHATMATPNSSPPVALLSKLGIHLAVDDLGTGYTTLQFLRDLPIRELKFDAQLISTLGATDIDHTATNILRTLVELAHSLKLTATAQGVATRLEADRLAALCFDTAQGLLYGEPLTSDAVAGFLTRASRR